MLKVAYDGTNYHGWQAQDNADTIEKQLKCALEDLTNEVNELIGGSRTDAGVHARSNIAVFDTETSIPGEKFAYALNVRLPADIRVVESKEVEINFHPRHCDSKKTYEYTIYNSEFPDPLKRLYSHFSYTKYDVEAMIKAASYIEGEHDFTSFCTVGAQVDSKVRTVYSCEVLTKDNGYTLQSDKPIVGSRDIIIRVSGNGFLYNMVRIIAGTLMEVGAGRIKPEEVKDIILAMDRKKAGPTAPANGLCLMKYEFL